MIRRLRIKFVCINMTIVTIMLCVIFGTVLRFTSASLEEESLHMMQSVALDPLQLGVPGQEGDRIRLPYFALQLSPGGELLVSSGGYFDLSDRAILEELIALSSLQGSGVLPEYGLRYIRVGSAGNQCIVFADMSSETSTIHNLLRSCLLIGAASFVVFLIISILLAHWAVKPVEEAWDQQRRFVADASHELKTPLTVILSSAQLLAGNGDDPQLRQRLTANILAVSEQMKDLVTRLLNSAQVDHGLRGVPFTVLNLSETAAQAMLPFDPIFYERGLELSSDIRRDIRVRGSEAHLTQLVGILLDNAAKYSRPGGGTRVTLRSRGRRACLLSVANDGPPLTPRERKAIFKRFYRADGARERTGSYGLGLSIAEGIVKAHRGKIWVESRDGVNTFFVQFPAVVTKE